jgi:hypothetical protein
MISYSDDRGGSRAGIGVERLSIALTFVPSHAVPRQKPVERLNSRLTAPRALRLRSPRKARVKASLRFIPAVTSHLQRMRTVRRRWRTTRTGTSRKPDLSPPSPVLPFTSESFESFYEKDWKGATWVGLSLSRTVVRTGLR